MKPFAALLCLACAAFAQKPSFDELWKATAGPPNAATENLLRSAFTADQLKKGEAWMSQRGDFLFAIESASEPLISIDGGPVSDEGKRSGNLWFFRANLKTGTIHKFTYFIDGQPFGGRNDLPAYTDDHYANPGVPQGTLSEKIVHESKIYPGMKSDYWTYAPAQYDPSKPAAVMIWQDGEIYVERNANTRLQNAIDNLTHQKKIPAMIHIFISPGLVGQRRMRSVEYDSVNDTYPRFLLEEILPEVSKKFNLRTDGYSRAIAGDSSGGICAFNAAWQRPQEFSRVLSRIGSFTSIQWQPGVLDGGNVYPFKIRKEPKRNIRVWLQDGSEDLENPHGSWPLQNVQMANSLKFREYDFKFRWGFGTHSRTHGNVEVGEELEWLWRDYDPAKSSQDFTMDPAEKSKPYYRIQSLNRE